MRIGIVLVLSMLTLFSCQRELKEKGEEPVSVWNCGVVSALDSLQIMNRLPGNWQWLQRTCFATGAQVTTADRDIRLQFQPDGKYFVRESGVVITEGNWSIRRTMDNNWTLVVSQPSEFLYGLIYFCSTMVQFADSYVDGCDHMFGKLN